MIVYNLINKIMLLMSEIHNTIEEPKTPPQPKRIIKMPPTPKKKPPMPRRISKRIALRNHTMVNLFYQFNNQK